MHLSGSFTTTLPDIALYETGNALRYKNEFSSKEISKCLDDLEELHLDTIAPYAEIAELTIEIARQNDITFYDAFYVALTKNSTFNLLLPINNSKKIGFADDQNADFLPRGGLAPLRRSTIVR